MHVTIAWMLLLLPLTLASIVKLEAMEVHGGERLAAGFMYGSDSGESTISLSLQLQLANNETHVAYSLVVLRVHGHAHQEQVHSTPLTPGEVVSSVYNVTAKGLYTVRVVPTADGVEGDGVLLGVATGAIALRNPWGYLPGHLHGCMEFLVVMAAVYLVLALAWGVLCVVFRKEVIQHHGYIGVVVLLGLVELLLWNVDVRHWNASGTHYSLSEANVLFDSALLLSVLRNTAARVMVLSISMGLGVAVERLSLEGRTRVVFLGLLYFTSSLASQLYTAYRVGSDASVLTLLVLCVPEVLANCLFFLWSIEELTATMDRLSSKKQFAKLQLYHRFSSVLMAAIGLAFACTLYSVVFVSSGWRYVHFEQLWFLDDGFYQALFAVILVAIMALWRPSSRSSRYAFSSELPQRDLDHPGVPDLYGLADPEAPPPSYPPASPPTQPRPVFVIDDDLDDAL